MSKSLEWPEGQLRFSGSQPDGRRTVYYVSCPKDGKVMFQRRVNKTLRLAQLPGFKVGDGVVLFAKLIASVLAPDEFRIPIDIIRGRRPARGSDEMFPVASEMRVRVETFAKAHIRREDKPVGDRSLLRNGGAIHLRQGNEELWLMYDREHDLLYFDREKIPVRLLIGLAPHVLRDELVKEVDSRYHFPWLPVLHPNLWRPGNPIPEPTWWDKRDEILPSNASSSADGEHGGDDGNQDEEEEPDAHGVSIPQDPELLFGLLREVAPRLELPLNCGAATEALRPVLHAAVVAAMEALRQGGVVARKPAITTVDEIPEPLKAPFAAYVEQLLEEGFVRVREAEEALAKQREKDRLTLESMLDEAISRGAEVDQRELAVSSREAEIVGRAAQLEAWERKIAEARKAIEDGLLHDAVELLANAGGPKVRVADRRQLEDAKFVVGHLRRRDVSGKRR